jgi:hypothetical protein
MPAGPATPNEFQPLITCSWKLFDFGLPFGSMILRPLDSHDPFEIRHRTCDVRNVHPQQSSSLASAA